MRSQLRRTDESRSKSSHRILVRDRECLAKEDPTRGGGPGPRDEGETAEVVLRFKLVLRPAEDLLDELWGEGDAGGG